VLPLQLESGAQIEALSGPIYRSQRSSQERSSGIHGTIGLGAGMFSSTVE